MTLKPNGPGATKPDERLVDSQRRQDAAYRFAFSCRGKITLADLSRQFGLHYDRARKALQRARRDLDPDLASTQRHDPNRMKRRFLAVIGDRMVHPSAIRPSDRVDRFTVEVM
jgi:hypothetical protein